MDVWVVSREVHVDKDKEPWTMTVDSAGKNVRFCPIDPGLMH